MFRQDPGLCPVCGAVHTACTADSGPVSVVQLPARDASVAVARRESSALLADVVQPTLPPGSFTTGTYRRPGKKTP